MSVACEAIGGEDEVSQVMSASSANNMEKGSFEEEELDYEEEIDDSKSNSNLKNDEDGEIVEDDHVIQEQPTFKNEEAPEKDEGELDDDDDLEEGEVKEDEEEEILQEPKCESNHPERHKILPPSGDNRSISISRPDMQRSMKPYYNNSYWPNSSSSYNSSSRYNSGVRSDIRYSSNRSRDVLLPNPPPPPQPSASESAWERGLKQARELLSKASKRKEEEVDFDNKRLNMTLESGHTVEQSSRPPPIGRENHRDKSPVKRRRHSSQHSSSEDEIERRHRLAYDAAPWNNSNHHHHHHSSSSNYSTTNNSYRIGGSGGGGGGGGGSSRNEYNNYYPPNRSAETYRDPWRRSKSPRATNNRIVRGLDADSRYGPDSARRAANIVADVRRSNSMSSLSSIASDASDSSPGRKLPYSRPNAESKNRNDREGDFPVRTDYPKSRMDRIPKKSNASHYQSKDRVSEAKSFDSWSESLSDSDSSSFFSNSDSDSDDSDAQNSTRNKGAKRVAKTTADKRKSQSKLLAKQQNIKSNSIETKQRAETGKKILAKTSRSKDEAKKAPIKMTFLKTQTSLKKDKLIDEQLNGEPLEPVEDLDANNSRSSKFSSGKSVHSKSQSEDEIDPKTIAKAPKDASSASSSALVSSSGNSSNNNNNNNNKLHRREELLLKLKAVEEAIERKLNSKKEI